MEVVGEFLGVDIDAGLCRFFRRHYGAWVPRLRRVHRTTFVRQPANRWPVKERLWQRWLAALPHDPAFALADRFPLPVFQFARAYRCHSFRGEAAFRKDTLARQSFSGFCVHVRLCLPGRMSQVLLAAVNVSELAAGCH